MICFNIYATNLMVVRKTASLLIKESENTCTDRVSQKIPQKRVKAKNQSVNHVIDTEI